MHMIIGSSAGTALPYFNLMALRLGFLKIIYSGWISRIPPTFRLEKLIQ